MQKEYDLICSFGGNCSVAHNLQYRNMRKFALPFDWCYFLEENAIDKFIEGLSNSFNDFAKKENLVAVEGNAAHSIVFKDLYSGYCFSNHFKTKFLDKEYSSFEKKFRRRTKRLCEYINQADSCLFIYAGGINLSDEKAIEIYNKLKAIYPNKIINLKVLNFNCKDDIEYLLEEGNISIANHKRDLHLYDFNHTSIEWEFLDKIKLTDKIVKKYNKSKINKIEFKKRRLKIFLLQNWSFIFSMTFMFLNFKFYICVGREKK